LACIFGRWVAIAGKRVAAVSISFAPSPAKSSLMRPIHEVSEL
jgi:hypothetical protein